MSIKISLMHCKRCNATKVMLPVVFKEFKVVYIFFCYFFFSLSLFILENSVKFFSKNIGGRGGGGGLKHPSPQPPGFYGPDRVFAVSTAICKFILGNA